MLQYFTRKGIQEKSEKFRKKTHLFCHLSYPLYHLVTPSKGIDPPGWEPCALHNGLINAV